MIESWLPTEGNYEVSDRGRVRHARTGRMRIARIDPGGYLALNIWCDGRNVRFKVHLLVLAAFSGERPSGMVARHLNGDSLDNRVSNLAWGTVAENAADAARHGRLRGEQNGRAKLTEQQVATIRSSPRSGADLAREFGVSTVLVCKIRRREAWAWA
jgi:hypothetical protein